MEWPAPPSGAVVSPGFRRRKRIMRRFPFLASILGKNVCSVVGLDASGAVVLRRRAKRETLHRAGGEASALHRGDGGLLRRSPSRPRVRRSRPRRAADVARICPALCQGAEERRSRRRGDRGSGDAADDAVRRTEEPGPARYADASSIARSVGRRADGSDQSAARHPAGARTRRRRRASGSSSSSWPS